MKRVRKTQIVWLATAVAAAWLFGVLAEAVIESPLVLRLDIWLLELIGGVRTNMATRLWLAITTLADWYVFALAVLLMVGWLWRRGQKHFAMSVLGLGIIEEATSGSLKLLFARPRPDLALSIVTESTSSFPSGHTLRAVVIAGIVVYLLLSRYRTVWQRAVIVTTAIVFAVLVGISRVYLGVHYPSDVVASWLLGLLLVSIWWLYVDWLRHHRARL